MAQAFDFLATLEEEQAQQGGKAPGGRAAPQDRNASHGKLDLEILIQEPIKVACKRRVRAHTGLTEVCPPAPCLIFLGENIRCRRPQCMQQCKAEAMQSGALPWSQGHQTLPVCMLSTTARHRQHMLSLHRQIKGMPWVDRGCAATAGP